MLYRFYRLRRLIALSLVLPILAVLAVAAFKGPASFILLTLAIGLPLAHVLRYPNAWTETLTVSLLTAILLALAGTIGPDIGLLGLGLRLLGLALLGAVLFFVLNGPVTALLMSGPVVEMNARARRRTRLSPAEAKAGITLYPGRKDAKVDCGEPDEDGAFPVTIHHKMPALCGPEETLDVLVYAQIVESGDMVHEVMSVDAGPLDDELTAPDETGEPADEETPPAITVTRHVFTPTKRGTLVDVTEKGGALTRGQALGFWLQDYFADHLTDELDRAEGRPARANRFAPQDQLVGDIARRLVGRTPATPAE